MADLTPIESLQRFIATELPTARLNLDAPHLPSGSWFIDVEWNGALAFVEWRPAQGFGVSPETTSYGEGPEVVTQDVTAAAAATVGFLRSQHGFRDALIVADETSVQTSLRESFLDVDITSDTVDARHAIEHLRQHAYRSVIVDTRIDVGEALLADLIDFMHRDLITIALLGAGTAPERTSEWAQILVRHTVDVRDLALMLRTLLRYGNDAIAGSRLPHDWSDSASNR